MSKETSFFSMFARAATASWKRRNLSPALKYWGREDHDHLIGYLPLITLLAYPLHEHIGELTVDGSRLHEVKNIREKMYARDK